MKKLWIFLAGLLIIGAAVGVLPDLIKKGYFKRQPKIPVIGKPSTDASANLPSNLSGRKRPKAQTGDTLEYKLAVIDAGGYVSKGHVSVARFRSLLNQLSYYSFQAL